MDEVRGFLLQRGANTSAWIDRATDVKVGSTLAVIPYAGRRRPAYGTRQSTLCSALVAVGLFYLFFLLSGSLHAAEMQYPLSVAVAEDGALYVADRKLPGIWKIADGKAEVYFQASKKFRTPLNAVRCVTFDSEGRLLAGDSATREVYRFDKEDKPQPLTKGAIGIPMDVAVDKDGNIFAADTELQRIWKIPAEGGEPVEVALLSGPRGLEIDDENRLWIVTLGKTSLGRLDNAGDAKVGGKKVTDKKDVAAKDDVEKVGTAKDGGATNGVTTIVERGTFEFPHDVVLDKEGTAYVVDGYARAVWKVPAEGKPEKWISGEPLVNPTDVAWQGENLLIVDPRANAIFTADPAGKLTKLFPPAGGDGG